MYRLSYKYLLSNLQVSVEEIYESTIYRHTVNVSVKLQVSVR